MDSSDLQLAITIPTDTGSTQKDSGSLYPDDEIEKAFLIDISANKQWIAYVTEDADAEALFLNVCRFRIPHTFEDSGKKDISGTAFEGPLRLDISSYAILHLAELCCFLSISPTGTRVALSFLKMDQNGQTEKKEKIYNPDTIIFKVDPKKGIMKSKRIKFKGRAVFLKDGHLALINTEVLEVYECGQLYRKIHWFNVFPLIAKLGNTHQETIVGLESLVKTSYVQLNTSRSESANSDAKTIIRISKHIRHNVLSTTYHSNVSRVWSITEDGVQLTSFHSRTSEEIMAFSLDYKYLATFVEKDKSISIYNVKSGLVINRLKQEKQPDSTVGRASDDFQIYVCFCHQSQYLAMVSIVKLDTENDITSDSDSIESNACNNNALITFEVWNIVPEKSIYYDSEEISIDWTMKDKFIQPFVYEPNRATNNALPEFKAVYSTRVHGGMSRIKIKTLDIFNPRQTMVDDQVQINNNELWKEWEHSTNNKITLVNDFDNNFDNTTGSTCFRRKIGEGSYLLLFEAKTVQLWQTSPSFENDGIITKQDKLIYIRAFKAPFYGFNEAYKDTWTRIETTDLENLVNYFETEGRVVISIKHEREFQEGQETDDYHRTEEIFLPINFMNDPKDTSFIHEYHYVQSACQALHYLSGFFDKDSQQYQEEITDNMILIYQKTKSIVKRSIRGMRARGSKYFTTISGSNTLAMLASFEVGREIIFDIIETDELPITLFSYARWSSQAVPGQTLDTSENALTILIEQFDYDLYELMFNRVIHHSKQLGTGCFSAVTDALIYLQERGNRDLLLLSTQKLSFLQIDRNILTILTSEVGEEMHMSSLHKDLVPDFRDLESHATREQVIKYNNRLGIDHFSYWWSFYISYPVGCYFKEFWAKMITEKFIANLFKQDMGKVNGSLIKLCVVPLPHFNSYSDFPEDRDTSRKLTKSNATVHSIEPVSQNYLTSCMSFFSFKSSTDNADAAAAGNENPTAADNDVIPYKAESAFIRLATNQHENDIFHQGDTVLEVLLQYKWDKFARTRFLMVYLLYLTYYISYSVGVSFSREVFGYELGNPVTDNAGHLACIIIMFIAGGILQLQEVHQLVKSHSRTAYLISLYNIIDMAAFVLPIVTFWQMITANPHLDEVNSISTLILWLHGILRLRVISLFGVTLETIIQLVQSVYKVLLIMLLVIFAFTNSFMVLLSRRDDSFFQEQYEGSLNLTSSGLSAENAMNYGDVSANNNFNNPFKSFSMLWFFIFGVWDPINDGDAGDDYMVMILAILFSFLTALIFFNLVIALMSSKVEEVRTRGKKVWISHFAAIVAEIEQLWCTNYENRCRKNNPTFIYYIAKTSDIKMKNEWLKDQTDELIKQLREDQAEKDMKSRPNYIKSVDDLQDLVTEDTDRLVEQLKKHERNATFSPDNDLVKEVERISKKLQDNVDELRKKLAALNIQQDPSSSTG